MNKSVIVNGEAPETDSEDEIINLKKNVCVMKNSVQGAVITGEDSESEDDNASVSSAVSALNQTKTTDKGDSVEANEKYNSLLHKKLRECNANLHDSVETYCDNVITNAGHSLITTDQQLLHSQLTIQAAVTSLRNLSINSNALKNKLHSLLSAKFIPNIKVNSNK